MLVSSFSEPAKAQSFEEGTNSVNLGISLLRGYSYAGYSGVEADLEELLRITIPELNCTNPSTMLRVTLL